MTIAQKNGWQDWAVSGRLSSQMAVEHARHRLLEYAPNHTYDELIEQVVNEAEALSESVISFFVLVDSDQSGATFQNWSTRTKTDFCSAEGKGMHCALASAGVWAESARTRVAAIHNDYASLPNRKGLPEGHAELIRELVVPVLRQGSVRAMLGVGNKATDYDQADAVALGQLADLAWDIAEVKILREELNLSLEKFQAVADNTFDWETWTAADGSYIYVSPSCNRITGHTAAEFMAKNTKLLVEITHPDDRARVIEHLRAGVDELIDDDLEIEFRVVRPNGEIRWISHVCTPVLSENGENLGRRASNRDVTRHKDIERRLAHERRLLDRVESVAHVGSWRIGLGKRELSDEAARILGFESAPTDGDVIEAVRGVIHPDDRALFEGPQIRALLADGIRSTDFRILRPDGTVRWISAHGDVELNESDEPVAVNGILQDITERKNLEERRVDRFEQDANTDRLTGLLNLRGFDLVADRAIAEAQRANHGIGLLFCDMDGLKNTNDQLGHLEGDRALRDAADVLRQTLRSADAIARVGGDEFVVLATGNDTVDATYLRERLYAGFDQFNTGHERLYQLAASCGTASCEPGAPCLLDALRAEADSQMYEEKLRRGATR